MNYLKDFLWENNEPLNYDPLNCPRSQDMNLFSENGAIYITKSKIFLKFKNRLGGKIFGYEMSQKYSIDIDSLDDFRRTEKILKS